MAESLSSQPNDLLKSYLIEVRELAKIVQGQKADRKALQGCAETDAQISDLIHRLVQAISVANIGDLDVYDIAEICNLTAGLTGIEKNDTESFLHYLRTISAFYAVPDVRGNIREAVCGSMPSSTMDM